MSNNNNSNKDKFKKDEFEDPKIALIFSLLRHVDHITECLDRIEESGPGTGFHKEIIRASLSMALLLRRVDLLDSDKEMLAIKNNITLQNYANINENYVLNAYDTINAFMNRTYFADIRKVKPQNQTVPIMKA